MPRTYLLLAAACIGGDAQIPPCPAGVKDDLNWYTTTSSGKVHDCAWLRLDPAAERLIGVPVRQDPVPDAVTRLDPAADVPDLDREPLHHPGHHRCQPRHV